MSDFHVPTNTAESSQSGPDQTAVIQASAVNQGNSIPVTENQGNSNAATEITDGNAEFSTQPPGGSKPAGKRKNRRGKHHKHTNATTEATTASPDEVTPAPVAAGPSEPAEQVPAGDNGTKKKSRKWHRHPRTKARVSGEGSSHTNATANTHVTSTTEVSTPTQSNSNEIPLAEGLNGAPVIPFVATDPAIVLAVPVINELLPKSTQPAPQTPVHSTSTAIAAPIGISQPGPGHVNVNSNIVNTPPSTPVSGTGLAINPHQPVAHINTTALVGTSNGNITPPATPPASNESATGSHQATSSTSNGAAIVERINALIHPSPSPAAKGKGKQPQEDKKPASEQKSSRNQRNRRKGPRKPSKLSKFEYGSDPEFEAACIAAAAKRAADAATELKDRRGAALAQQRRSTEEGKSQFNLPPELMTQVITHLDFQSRHHFALACHDTYAAVQSTKQDWNIATGDFNDCQKKEKIVIGKRADLVTSAAITVIRNDKYAPRYDHRAWQLSMLKRMTRSIYNVGDKIRRLEFHNVNLLSTKLLSMLIPTLPNLEYLGTPHTHVI